MLPQNHRFALNHDRKTHIFWAAFMLILRRAFLKTLIQKRRSKTPFTGSTVHCFPREEDDTFTEEGVSSEFSECLIQAIVPSSSELERRLL